MDGRVTIALELRWSIEWFFLPLIFAFPGARRLRLLLIASTGTWIRLGTNLVIV